ncbi:MAG: MarR family transcriptional regulator [Oscillospiraceae bacterium]|nr:MarR family transcriptional regulator [Oscillospiraceae bacterium]
MNLTEQEVAVFRAISRLRKVPVSRLHPQLTQGEWMLLNEVHCHGPKGVTVAALVKALEAPSPAVSRLMRGMEANGLIRREILPEDRRRVVVTVTPKGEEINRIGTERFHRFFRELMEGIPPEEFERMMVTWNQMMDRMEYLLQQMPAEMREGTE